jgi:hypothetical protein
MAQETGALTPRRRRWLHHCSVRRIAYDVNPDLFRWLGNRRDGREASASGL